jgi:hypothetical protein
VLPEDTSPIAHQLQIAVYRRLGPEARVALAISMSEEARRVMAAGIRARHPEYDDNAVLAAVRRLTLGDRLFRAAWPRAPVVPA